jgi:hypothetical protein
MIMMRISIQMIQVVGLDLDTHDEKAVNYHQISVPFSADSMKLFVQLITTPT